MSLPTYIKLSDGLVNNVKDVHFWDVWLSFRPNATDDGLDAVVAALKETVKKVQARNWGWPFNIETFDTRERSEENETVLQTLNFFFSGLTAVGMILCFFGLLASMVTNIREQHREIAMLRAIGLRGFCKGLGGDRG